jgi:hypothetical protein
VAGPPAGPLQVALQLASFSTERGLECAVFVRNVVKNLASYTETSSGVVLRVPALRAQPAALPAALPYAALVARRGVARPARTPRQHTRARMRLLCTALALAPALAQQAENARDEIGALVSRPFELVARIQRLTELGFDGWSDPDALTRTEQQLARATRQHLYLEMLHSGAEGAWTVAGGQWKWSDGRTSLHVSTEAGRFVGYYSPEGEQALAYRAPSGAVADSLWAPHADFAAVNECVSAGLCADAMDGRTISLACPGDARITAATCSACCTESCCDRDIMTLHRITYASRGEPVEFAGWRAFDPRVRPWYRQQRAHWEMDHSLTTRWSEPCEFLSVHFSVLTGHCFRRAD